MYKQNYFSKEMKIHLQRVKNRPEITYMKRVLRPRVTLMRWIILFLQKWKGGRRQREVNILNSIQICECSAHNI